MPTCGRPRWRRSPVGRWRRLPPPEPTQTISPAFSMSGSNGAPARRFCRPSRAERTERIFIFLEYTGCLRGYLLPWVLLSASIFPRFAPGLSKPWIGYLHYENGYKPKGPRDPFRQPRATG